MPKNKFITIGKGITCHMKKVISERRKETSVSFRTSFVLKDKLESFCNLHGLNKSDVMNELLVEFLK